MRRVWWAALAAIGLVHWAGISAGEVVWSENFADVNDWQVIADPGGGSSITTDGSQGLMAVSSPAEQAAFGPKPGVAPLVVVGVKQPGALTMSLTVSKLTQSVSYDIALDEFDAGTNYVNTIWQVFPATSTSTFTGTTNVPLGALKFSASTTYVLPKITVHTGEGRQAVGFSRMEFNVSPRPARPLP